MKITERRLRQIIREVAAESRGGAGGGMSSANPFSLEDYDSYLEKKPAHAELGRALLYLFDAVSADLGVVHPDDSAFVSYAGDRMYDSRVPDEVRASAKAWLKGGARGEFKG